MNERAVCTVATKNYLAHVRTLVASLHKYNPYIQFYFLLADNVDGYFDPDLEPFQVLTTANFGDDYIDVIQKMCFYYTPFEYCNALKAYLHHYILNKTTTQYWIYFDSDIRIFHSLDTIFRELEQSNLVFTPHTLNPLSVGRAEHELAFLRAGVFNGGFLGLARSEATRSFINWFKERLTCYSFDDISTQGHQGRGLYVDQKWLNLAYIYFGGATFLSHPGANIAYWNLHERELLGNAHHGFSVNGEPLLFFHFSGWDINDPYMVSKHPSSYRFYNNPAWINIADLYKNELLSNGYNTTSKYPYSYHSFHTGEVITLAMRRQFYESMENNDTLCRPFNQARRLRSLVIRSLIKRTARQLLQLPKRILSAY